MKSTLLRCIAEAHSQDSQGEVLERLLDLLPSGSGLDSGVKLKHCDNKRIVFGCDYHHMDDNGFYCGWSLHDCVIRADLSEFGGFSLKITGRDKRQIKEYLADTLNYALQREVIFTYGTPTLKG